MNLMNIQIVMWLDEELFRKEDVSLIYFFKKIKNIKES